MFRRLNLFVTVVSLALVFAINGFGQGTTTRITGVVTDNSGASVEGATVTLTNEATNISRNTQSSDSGVYVFDLIQAGTYQITVEKQGFKKFISKGNMVNVNTPATINAALQIGDVSASVTVQSSAEQVQTSTSGNVGTTIEQKALESLPIFGQRGRNPLDLVNFVPGASTDIANETGGGVHVHGSRDRAFNFTLDGIDINESSAGGSNFTPLRPNPDSLQEFQIVTSNFTAELGRSSGAQVTFVTKSGGNEFHGNAFEYYQTPRLNANEYGNKINNRPKGQFVQHIFGGSFSGPLFNPGFGEGTKTGWLKDRAFFFVNLQMLRAYETRLQTRTVFTQQARTGQFRYVVGGQNSAAGTSTASVNGVGTALLPNCGGTVTTNCIATYNLATQVALTPDLSLDPTTTGLLNAMPLPNNFFSGDGLNTAGFSFGAPQREKQYDFVSKFDFKVNDKNSFYIRYAQGQQNTIGDAGNGGLQAFPGYPNKVDTFRDPKNMAINYTLAATSKLTNEFIFGFNNFAFSFNNPDPNYATNPAFILNIATDPYSNGAPVLNARRLQTIQFVDNLTYVLSSHTLKGGINFRFGKQTDDRSGVAGIATTPDANFSTATNPVPASYAVPAAGATSINTNDRPRLLNYINDMVGRFGRYRQAFVALPDGSAFAPAGTKWDFIATYPEYDFYIQDTWKARSNLTIDLGLRWEMKLNPTSGNNRPILKPAVPFTIGAPASTALSWTEGDLFKDDLNNFSPSVGFAWDPFKSGKTSIRANYRLSYDRFNSFVFASSIFQSAPGNTIAVTNTTGGLLRNGYPVLTPSVTPAAARIPASFSQNSITVVDPNIVFPEIHQFSVSFQRELFKNTIFEFNYITNRGEHLFGGYDSNQVNIRASDPRCPGETFLSAFNAIRGGTTNNSCLINFLWNGTNANNGGTLAFIANSTISPLLSTSATSAAGGGVATAAAFISQNRNSQMVANGFASSFFQRYPQFSGGLFVLDSNDISRYHGLEFILNRRITDGLGFNLSYTWSKSKDTRSFDPTFTTVGTGTGQAAGSTPFDLNDRMRNYAWSDFDRRHAFRATYTYDLPFGKGKMFGSDMPAFLDYIVGGWQLAGLLNVTSGRPFTVYAGNALTGVASGVNTVSNVVVSTANCNGCSRDMGQLVQENGTYYFFDTAQRAMFSAPAPGEFGNTGRNFFIGPKFFQTDLSLSKKFKLTEKINFDFRVDAKNLTNSISFTNPINTSTNTAFGQIRDRVFSSTFARKLQVGLKLNF